MEEVHYAAGGAELLETIRSMWERLNELHHDRSVYFQDHYASYTFDERREELLRKSEGGLRVDIAILAGEPIGYCVCTVHEGGG